MNDLNPHDVSEFESMIDFFCKHPPPEGDDGGEEYLAALRAFPNSDDNVVSVAEVTRHRATVLGCEVVLFQRPLVVRGDGHNVGWGRRPIPTVMLPDGSTFDVESAHDLAALRALLKEPVER